MSFSEATFSKFSSYFKAKLRKARIRYVNKVLEKLLRSSELFCRNSDSSKVKEAVERKGRQGHHKLSKKRHINFVIFVINAVAVHKILQSGDNLSRPNFLRIFKFPFITFKGQSHTHTGAFFSRHLARLLHLLAIRVPPQLRSYLDMMLPIIQVVT